MPHMSAPVIGKLGAKVKKLSLNRYIVSLAVVYGALAILYLRSTLIYSDNVSGNRFQFAFVAFVYFSVMVLGLSFFTRLFCYISGFNFLFGLAIVTYLSVGMFPHLPVFFVFCLGFGFAGIYLSARALHFFKRA